MTLAHRIRSARAEAGLTQKQVAAAMEVSVQAVSQWETNKTEPELEKIAKLSNLLRVDWNWLIGHEGNGELVKQSHINVEFAGRVPVIELIEILNFDPLMINTNYKARKSQMTIEPTYKTNGHCFAIEAKENDEHLGLRVHDIVVFGTMLKPVDQDLIAVIKFNNNKVEANIEKFIDNDSSSDLLTPFASNADGHPSLLSLLIDTGLRAMVVGTAIERRQILRPDIRSSTT